MTKQRLLAAVFGLTLMVSAPAFAPSAYAMDERTLLEAVKDGDTAAVQALLTSKADPNVTLADTSTVLAWAVAHQNPEIVRALLAAGANPNAHDRNGMTPFLFACQGSDAGIVGMFIDAKADVMAKRPDGISALSYCARYSSPAILQRMIAGGATVENVDINGQTPLMWAAADGRVDNINVLLKAGANVNAASKKGFTPLFFAIKSPSGDAPKALIAAGANINQVAVDGTTALMLAGYSKKFDLASDLVNRGADTKVWDQNGHMPLHVAALNNQTEYARLLISKGADPNGVTAPSKLDWQIEPNAGRRPPPRYVGLTPLLVAAENGQPEIMKMLVASGAKPNFRASDGTSVVLSASESGSLAALSYAIEIDPDTTAATDAGVTPMHLVFYNPSIQSNIISKDMGQMVKLIADKGYPVDAKTIAGKKPLDNNRTPPPEVRKIYDQVLIDYAPRLSEVMAASEKGGRRR